MLKRSSDFIFAIILIVLLFPVFVVVAVAIKLSSEGPVLFKQNRVGKNNVDFTIYKFRTMRLNAPNVASYLLKNPDEYLVPIGKFMRRTSLDELPQLFNILKGDMSFVGPRPVIEKEKELIKLRTKAGVHKLVPGLTGWAQINGRDTVLIHDKVRYDKYYLDNQSLWFDLKIVIKTALKVLKTEGVVEGNKVLNNIHEDENASINQVN